MNQFDLPALSRKTRRRLLREKASRREVVNTWLPAGGLTAVSDYNLSTNLWSGCPKDTFVADPAAGYFFYDDFTRKGGLIADPTITTVADLAPGYKAFASSGSSVLKAQNTTAPGGGILVFTTNNNDGANIATIATPFQIAQGKGDFWFEARVKTSNVTTAGAGGCNDFFVGLLETCALTAIVPITATGTLADQNLVGFFRQEAAPTALTSAYKANGVTAVTVQATVATLAAATYFKVGMHYEAYSHTLFFYYNGLLASSSKSIPSAAGTDFPNDVLMGPCFASVSSDSGNGDNTETLDWWAFAQAY